MRQIVPPWATNEVKIFFLKSIEHLARQVRLGLASRSPQDLYGIWRGHFPDDFDIDAALKDIRHEWEKEWEGDVIV